jgi:RNA polymerase sigma-70 factor, ECF subfamily
MIVKKPTAEPAQGDCDTATPEGLFRCHAQAVFAVCLANTKNYHDAEDVVQAVFAKAVAKIPTLRQPSRARAWLLQVARRTCVDFHRRRRQAEPLLEEPSAPPPMANGACERLHEAIQKLPLNYREVIVLYYLDSRSCSNVAASLGLAEPAVRQRLVRARAMLHDLLQEDRP